MNTIAEDISVLKEEIVLKKTNYVRVSGVACCTLWDNDEGEIEMRDYYIEVEPGTTNEEIKHLVFENANDSEFGVQSIDSVIVDLYVLYKSDAGDVIERVIAENLEING